MSKGVSRVEYQSSTRKARSVFQRLGSPAPSSYAEVDLTGVGFSSGRRP